MQTIWVHELQPNSMHRFLQRKMYDIGTIIKFPQSFEILQKNVKKSNTKGCKTINLRRGINPRYLLPVGICQPLPNSSGQKSWCLLTKKWYILRFCLYPTITCLLIAFASILIIFISILNTLSKSIINNVGLSSNIRSPTHLSLHVFTHFLVLQSRVSLLL